MRFLKDEDGSTAIEYALIASLISISIIGVVSQVGTTVNEMFFGKVVAAFASAS